MAPVGLRPDWLRLLEELENAFPELRRVGHFEQERALREDVRLVLVDALDETEHLLGAGARGVLRPRLDGLANRIDALLEVTQTDVLVALREELGVEVDVAEVNVVEVRFTKVVADELVRPRPLGVSTVEDDPTAAPRKGSRRDPQST
jgi:hypothetical protein